jgi:outer membrane receptor protein involved in Fe transport
VSLADDWLYNTLSANLDHFPYPTRNTWLNNIATEFHFPGFNLQANVLNTIVSDKVRQYTSAGDKNELTPAILASWKPFTSENIRVRGFYKDIFRMPTFNDLYYTDIGYTFLKPEFARQYDLGITYDKVIPDHWLTLFSVQADAYFNRVTDKIIAVPGDDGFRWSMENLGIVDVKGLEINAQALWRFSHDLSVRTAISYTHEQSLDMDLGDDYKQQIPYTPLNNGSLLISGDWRRFALNYSFIYTGYRYDESANIPENYLQPWYTHDLAINYTLPIRRQQLKGGMEVNNLFNQYYEVVMNFPMPGRSYRFTLQYSL